MVCWIVVRVGESLVLPLDSITWKLTWRKFLCKPEAKPISKYYKMSSSASPWTLSTTLMTSVREFVTCDVLARIPQPFQEQVFEERSKCIPGLLTSTTIRGVLFWFHFHFLVMLCRSIKCSGSKVHCHLQSHWNQSLHCIIEVWETIFGGPFTALQPKV